MSIQMFNLQLDVGECTTTTEDTQIGSGDYSIAEYGVQQFKGERDSRLSRHGIKAQVACAKSCISQTLCDALKQVMYCFVSCLEWRGFKARTWLPVPFDDCCMSNDTMSGPPPGDFEARETARIVLTLIEPSSVRRRPFANVPVVSS